MLEPIEPTEGSEPNTPSDTLPPRRRRRAASRPAGPPAAAADTTAETVAPAIPAAGAADLIEGVDPAEDPELVEPEGADAETDAEADVTAEADKETEAAQAAPAAPRQRPWSSHPGQPR
ncbi:hypothetical protein ACFSJI_34480, partial [Streptomyces calvus]|uniref:hypothetical protein n=1 Tax=Streptomyces calvus TaxID=67282 RepID=UPI0036291E62